MDINDQKIMFSDTGYTIARFDSGIVYVDFLPDVDIDLDAAKKIISCRKADLKGCSLPFIVYADNLKKVSNEALDYFGLPESLEHVKILAVVTNSKFQIIIVNFFMLFSRPAVPVRMFKDKQEAIDWIAQF